MLIQFKDRKEAGKLLAAKLTANAYEQNVIVLCLVAVYQLDLKLLKHYTFHLMLLSSANLAYQGKQN